MIRQHSVRRGALCALTAAILILSTVLSACNGGGTTPPVTSENAPTASAAPEATEAAPTSGDETTETPKTEKKQETAKPETTAFPLVTVPTVTVPLASGTDRVTVEELRLTPSFFFTDRQDVLSVAGDGTAYTFTPIGKGSDTVTFVNSYGETAGVAVTVTDGGAMSLTLIPFVEPNVSYNVLDEGARANGVFNSTTYIQQCIDKASKAGGGTVYCPAGKYVISSLSMKPGVSLRFEGVLPDARVGYTDEVKAFAESDRVAYVKTSGTSKSNFFFFNVVPQAYCTEGTSDFLISGGVFDCQAKMKTAGFACGNNIVVENMIIKDNPNNHAFQLEGCSNVTLRNLLFAGYNYPATDAVLTRETIQLEPTTSGAIGSNNATNPIQCNDGDYHHCKNISVLNCYFGKSDKYGPHLVALGHHSASGGESVDGLVFSGNVIDNPLYCGLHLLDALNVRITDNKFISDSPATAASLGSDSALISLYSKNSAVTYTDLNGKKITYMLNYELPGDRNYVIENNEITVGGGTFLRAVYVGGASTDYNLAVVYKDDTSTLRVTEYNGKPFMCNGYVQKTNCMYNIRFDRNTVNVTSPIAPKDAFAYFSIVKGLTLEDNRWNVAEGVSFTAAYDNTPGLYGVSITTGTETYTKKATISRSALTRASITYDGKTYALEPRASQSVGITFKSDGHGEVLFDVDRAGNLSITVSAFDGYRFAGWTDADGKSVTLTETPEKSTTVVAVFAPVS